MTVIFTLAHRVQESLAKRVDDALPIRIGDAVIPYEGGPYLACIRITHDLPGRRVHAALTVGSPVPETGPFSVAEFIENGWTLVKS